MIMDILGCTQSMAIWGWQQNIHSHISCLIPFFYYASFCVTILKYVRMITHFPFQSQFLIDFYPILTEMSLHSHFPATEMSVYIFIVPDRIKICMIMIIQLTISKIPCSFGVEQSNSIYIQYVSYFKQPKQSQLLPYL